MLTSASTFGLPVLISFFSIEISVYLCPTKLPTRKFIHYVNLQLLHQPLQQHGLSIPAISQVWKIRYISRVKRFNFTKSHTKLKNAHDHSNIS